MGAVLLAIAALDLGIWQPAPQLPARKTNIGSESPRGVRSQGALTYYLVASQTQADVLEQQWANDVYATGLPDLPARQVVIIGSAGEAQQFQPDMAGFDADAASTGVQVVDLRPDTVLAQPSTASGIDTAADFTYYLVDSQEAAAVLADRLAPAPGRAPINQSTTGYSIVIVNSPEKEAQVRQTVDEANAQMFRDSENVRYRVVDARW